MAVKGIQLDGQKVRNESGSDMAAGDLVYVSGYDATDASLVLHADADDVTKKAEYILVRALADTKNDSANLAAEEDGLDTSAATIGDPVYLSATAGGWTLTEPTVAAISQIVGRVMVVSSTVGKIKFALPGPLDTHNSSAIGRTTLNDGTEAAKATTLGLGLASAALTALAGGGASGATALAPGFNQISVCATGALGAEGAGAGSNVADSVILPTAIAGMEVVVNNGGAKDGAIFPATGATINGLAANASIGIPVNGNWTLRALNTTTWISMGREKQTWLGAITAHTGNDIDEAEIMSASHNQISVSANSGDSVVLPVIPYIGYTCTIENDGANAVDVFPNDGAQIDGGGAETAKSLAAADIARYRATTLLLWTLEVIL